jgi:hypothetical protein
VNGVLPKELDLERRRVLAKIYSLLIRLAEEEENTSKKLTIEIATNAKHYENPAMKAGQSNLGI